MLEETHGSNSMTFQFVEIFFSFRFLTNWNSVGLTILIHKYMDTHMYSCMYVNNFLKHTFLWWDIYEKSLEGSSWFFTLWPLPQVTRNTEGVCDYPSFGPVLKSQATKRFLLFWSRHPPMMPETEMLRLEYQRITNQTKQTWLLNLLLIEQPFPLATSHKESFGNMQVEIHFYQSIWSVPLLK